MKRTAVYPGSFDPVTNGHMDIIHRAAQVFDRLIVAVALNLEKEPFFSQDERVDMLQKACSDCANVEVDTFGGLLVEYARRRGAGVIIKGLRAVSDFEFEMQMALMNKRLMPDIETMFMMTSADHSFLSSRIVKEIASLGGAVDELAPPHVAAALMRRNASSHE